MGQESNGKTMMGSEGTRNENNRTKEKPSPPAVFLRLNTLFLYVERHIFNPFLFNRGLSCPLAVFKPHYF
jgi:hypothetical protein